MTTARATPPARQRASPDDGGPRAYEHLPVAVLVFDASGAAVGANEVWSLLTGRSESGAVGQGWERAVHPGDVAALRSQLASGDGCQGMRSIDCRLRRDDGTVVWTRWSWRSTATPTHRRLVAIIDIDRERVRERELLEQASRDPLTGLANRRHFVDAVDQRLSGSRDRARIDHRTAGPAVLFLDLDHFKALNDSAGHLAGDLVLRTVADRLRRAVRPGDLVARLGGDEFAVLCAGSPDKASVAAIAERIRRAFDEPFQLTEGRWAIDVSVGSSLATSPATSAQALIDQADRAMYASRSARGRAESPTGDADGWGRPSRQEVLRRLTEVGLLLALADRPGDRPGDRSAEARDAVLAVIDDLVRDIQRGALERRVSACQRDGRSAERDDLSPCDAIGMTFDPEGVVRSIDLTRDTSLAPGSDSSVRR